MAADSLLPYCDWVDACVGPSPSARCTVPLLTMSCHTCRSGVMPNPASSPHKARGAFKVRDADESTRFLEASSTNRALSKWGETRHERPAEDEQVPGQHRQNLHRLRYAPRFPTLRACGRACSV